MLRNFTTVEKYTNRAYKIYNKNFEKYGSSGFEKILSSDEDGLFLHMADELGIDEERFREEAVRFTQMQSSILAAKAFNINALISSEKSNDVKNLFYEYRDKTDWLKEIDKNIDKLLYQTKIENLLDDMVFEHETTENELKVLRKIGSDFSLFLKTYTP